MPQRNTHTNFFALEKGERSGRQAILYTLVCLFIILGVTSCTKPIDINVSANEPIKVDLSMDVHVYQHSDTNPDDKIERQTLKDVMTQKRNRMREIQKLKNNQLVGEGIEGLLSIRNLPAGEYGSYVKKTVDAENKDRNFLMSYDAEKNGKPLAEIRREQWRHAQRKAFPGELVQVESETDPGTFVWIQKKSAME